MRVRSVEVHDREVTVATGGQRVALNLTGIDRHQVSRGQWVVKDPSIEPTYLADVRLVLLPDSPAPLPRVSRARVDHGTAEILAKVVLADRESLEPGGSCYAQVRFEERILVYPGDQFILRSVTPVTTIGGGRVVDPAPHKHGTGPRWHDRLALLEQGPPDAIADLLLEESFPLGLVRGRLEASPYLWRSATAEIGAAVAGLLADGRALPAGAGTGAQAPAAPVPRAAPGAEAAAGAAAGVVERPAGAQQRLFHGPSLLALSEATLVTLRARAETDSLNPYLTLGELRRELAGGKEWPALDAALERLQGAGEAVRTEHGYRWAGAAAAPDAGQSEAIERLLGQFGAAGAATAVASAPGAPIAAESPSVTVAAEATGLALVRPKRSSTLSCARAGWSRWAKTSTIRRTVSTPSWAGWPRPWKRRANSLWPKPATCSAPRAGTLRPCWSTWTPKA